MARPAPGNRRAPVTLDDIGGAPARLVVLQGHRVGQKYLLDRGETLVGRADEAQIDVPDPQLSRRHALIRRLPQGGYVVEDLGSSNGTFVNGLPVERITGLALGDQIRFGAKLVMLFTLYDPVEEQILQRQRLEALGRLAAGIAHDFNNMLGAVLSNIDFLQALSPDERAGEQGSECLRDMRSAASRAAGLSQRLLSFARGERHGEGPVDVAAACEEVAHMAQRTFGSQIQVETKLEPGLWVMGESMELYQVLMNLCVNARDAMAGGGKLSIASWRMGTAAPDRDLVVIRVADTGSGMDAEAQARAFEPFFTTKRGGGGFGIGLATVRQIVESFGGTIELDSTPGAGTRFDIALPPARGGEEAAEPPRKHHTLPNVPLAARRILLVDDEPMVRAGARRLLHHAGHTVVEAGCGEEAVACYASDGPFDVVLLDVEMPNGSGDEALEALLELDPQVNVLMMSGHRDAARAKAAIARGARAFLGKPWQADELLAAVNRVATADLKRRPTLGGGEPGGGQPVTERAAPEIDPTPAS